jgi:hypothetical protein
MTCIAAATVAATVASKSPIKKRPKRAKLMPGDVSARMKYEHSALGKETRGAYRKLNEESILLYARERSNRLRTDVAIDETTGVSPRSKVLVSKRNYNNKKRSSPDGARKHRDKAQAYRDSKKCQQFMYDLVGFVEKATEQSKAIEQSEAITGLLSLFTS